MDECYFYESNTHPWSLFTFLTLYKWYQIARSVSYVPKKQTFADAFHFKKYTFKNFVKFTRKSCSLFFKEETRAQVLS